MIVEDVHWVDPSSRDLLSFVVHNARRDRLVVVVTYRPDELYRGHPLRAFVAELERSGRAERLELGGLDRADVTEQIRAVTGRQPPGGMIDAIFARSEGNPFFVEELLASTGRGAGLPSSLREALLLRVAGLSARTQAVLSAAAAIGPLESAKIRCPRGHWFNGPIEFLAIHEQPAAAAVSVTSASANNV